MGFLGRRARPPFGPFPPLRCFRICAANCGESQIPDRQRVPGKGLVNHGLKGAFMLKPVGQGIAHDGNMVAGLEFKLLGKCRGSGHQGDK